MSRRVQELNTYTLKFLEDEIRGYKKIPSEKTQALMLDNQNAFRYHDLLYCDIKSWYEKLAPELKEIVNECFWGENNFYDWETIGEVYLGKNQRDSYAVRYEMLEKFAIIRGILVR